MNQPFAKLAEPGTDRVMRANSVYRTLSSPGAASYDTRDKLARSPT